MLSGLGLFWPEIHVRGSDGSCICFLCVKDDVRNFTNDIYFSLYLIISLVSQTRHKEIGNVQHCRIITWEDKRRTFASKPSALNCPAMCILSKWSSHGDALAMGYSVLPVSVWALLQPEFSSGFFRSTSSVATHSTKLPWYLDFPEPILCLQHVPASVMLGTESGAYVY